MKPSSKPVSKYDQDIPQPPVLIFGQFYSRYWVIFPMPKSIFFPQFLEENSQFQIRKIIIFLMAKVGLKLSNIQHCTFSYNTSCNGDYMLTPQLNSDLYLMYFII